MHNNRVGSVVDSKKAVFQGSDEMLRNTLIRGTGTDPPSESDQSGQGNTSSVKKYAPDNGSSGTCTLSD